MFTPSFLRIRHSARVVGSIFIIVGIVASILSLDARLANAGNTYSPEKSADAVEIIFYDGFESGSLGENWSISTTNQGRVQVSSAHPYVGTYGLLLDDWLEDSTYSIAAAILAVDLSGQTQVELDFYWYEYDETDFASDGVYISDDDGYTWSRILSSDADPTDWRHEVIDLDRAAANASRDFTDNFLIKFQFYDDDPIPINGFAFDEVRVQVPHVPTPASLPYYTGFESGELGEEWAISFTNDGRIRVDTNKPYAGAYSLLLDDWLEDSTYSIAAAILAVDLSGQTQVELDFYWYEYDETDFASDGVYISDDNGYTWSRILSSDADPTDWRHEVIDLDEAAANASRDFTDNFLIKFQFYDDDPIPINGFAFDEVRVQVPHVPTPASLPYYTGFESGELGEEWAISFTNDGRIRVDTDKPYGGAYSLLLDDWIEDSIYSIAAAILAVDLSVQTQVILDFYWYEYDASDLASDGVYISDDDGYTWSRILSFEDDPTDWKHEVIDLDEAAATASRDFTDNFLIKFQFYDDDPIPLNGFAFDEVQVRQNAPPTLQWTGQTNYEQDGLNPEEGMDSDLYIYKILYKDEDNDPPSYPRVHILKSGLDITGSPFYMGCSSGDYITGVTCSCYINDLEAGDDYTYYFTAQDDQGNLAVPTIILDAPDVTLTLRVYLPLTNKIFGIVTEAPTLYPIDNPTGDYEFTVSWSSVEKADSYTLEEDTNALFSSPRTVYLGSNTTKTVTVSSLGTYYYRVKAVNEISESAWSNIQSTLVTVSPPSCPETGWWAGPIACTWDCDGWMRFYVDVEPYCQVEEMEITLDVCGGTMVQTLDIDTLISDDKFSMLGLSVDEYIRGTFLSSSYAEGSLLLYVDCVYPYPTVVEVNGTWDASP